MEREYAERQARDRVTLQSALDEMRERATTELAQLHNENERLRQLDAGYCSLFFFFLFLSFIFFLSSSLLETLLFLLLYVVQILGSRCQQYLVVVVGGLLLKQ